MVVVDILEAIEVEQQQRHVEPGPLGLGDGVGETSVEHGAVGEAGESIVLSEVGEAAFHALLLDSM